MDVRVKTAPQRPLMIFDGDCGFCRSWIRRWKRITGDAVDYVPFQNDSLRERFPEIVNFGNSVQLIAPDGSVYQGAEAVVRSLATNSKRSWILWIYRNVPGVGTLSNFSYKVVAKHRSSFSALSRLFGGTDKC